MAYVRWLGHAAFEVGLAGARILVDPWLTNPMSPVSIDEYSGNVDLIVVTHDHGDHLGETIELVKRNPKARVVAVYELANHIAALTGAQDRVIGANIGGPVEVPGLNVKVVLTPAYHSCSRGAPTGAVLLSSEGAVYHAGDTGLMADMQWIGELYKPKVALLPIGGHFTMDVVQAAKAVEWLKPEYAVPMHYNTFPVIKADPEQFKKLVEEKGLQTKVVILKPGEKLEF